VIRREGEKVGEGSPDGVSVSACHACTGLHRDAPVSAFPPHVVHIHVTYNRRDQEESDQG
jgi:hypothetical protein